MAGETAAEWGTLTLHDLHTLPTDVAALFEQAELQDPQFGLAWYRNLASTVFDSHAGLGVHILRRKGRAIAALPVVASKAGLGHKVTALGNYYTSLYSPALADDVQPDELALLVRHAVRAHAPMQSLQLAPMAPGAPGFALMRAAMAAAGLVPFDYFCFGNWYQLISGDADQYLASRPGDLRSTLRRMGKKFSAAGGRFEIVSAPDQAADAAAAFVSVYGSSWKQPEPYAGFIPGLANLCAHKGWLRLGLAMIDKQVVAAQLWIVASGKANIYKLAYDPAFRQLSPGSLLTAQLMKHVIDVDKVREIDYLTGDDAYKNQWMSSRRERRGLIAFNPRSLGGLAGLVRESSARRLKPLFRRQPGADAVATPLAHRSMHAAP